MKYSDEHKTFVLQNKHMKTDELTKAFNEHFGLNQSKCCIRGLKERLGISKFGMKKQMSFDDIIGKKYGYLEVLGVGEPYIYPDGRKKTNRALCRCVCGKEISVFRRALKTGQIKSCGCMQVESLRKKNDFFIDANVVHVKLTNCNEEMICDVDDWEKLKNYCWSKGKTGYAEARVGDKTTLFHHLVIDCPKDLVRDHINRNKLDNRKNNLRAVTRLVNNHNVDKKCRNEFGHIGVYRCGNRIASRFYYAGKCIYVGVFDTVDEAVAARDKKQKEYLSGLGVI